MNLNEKILGVSLKYYIAMWLASLIVVVSDYSHAQTSLQCKVIATHRESSGEALTGSKAVLEVIQNRIRISGKSACKVIKEPGQFPWAKRKKVWKISKDQWEWYKKVKNTKIPLAFVGKDVYYFNTSRPKYGKYCCKIGNHYFSYLA